MVCGITRFGACVELVEAKLRRVEAEGYVICHKLGSYNSTCNLAYFASCRFANDHLTFNKGDRISRELYGSIGIPELQIGRDSARITKKSHQESQTAVPVLPKMEWPIRDGGVA